MSEFDGTPTAPDSDDEDGNEASSDTKEEVSPLYSPPLPLCSLFALL